MLLIAIITLLIPIVLILSNAYVSLQKIKLGNAAGLSPKELSGLTETLRRLENENRDLKNRIINIETIVTEEGWEKLHPQSSDSNLKAKIEKMAREMARLKKSNDPPAA